jgi:hypothetical protein
MTMSNQRMLKNVSIWLLAALAMLFHSSIMAAGCSNLIGSVVFNEVNHHNQSCDYSYTHDVFVELRALDMSIVNSSKFTDFTLTVCAVYPQVEDNSAKPRCYSGNPAVGYGTGLNGATGTNPQIVYEPALTYANAENSGNPWIVLYGDGGKIPKCYLDVNADQGNTSHGMELVLYDKNGDIIDYQLTDDMSDFSGVSTAGYLGNGSCTFTYDNYFDGANGFNVQRVPDGTGCWPDGNWTSDTCIGTPTKPPSGNSGSETTNTTNDTLPSGTTDVPLIIIDDVTVAPGGNATFTLSIYGYYNLASEAINTSRTTNEAAGAIQITYMTLDGSATQPSDYTAVASSASNYTSIPSGGSTATITIATNGTATVDEYFDVLLTAVLSSATAPAIIYDFSGRATFAQPVDHYAISHSGSGITCEAEAITVTAHDINHLAVAPSAATTITLSTTPGNDGWSLKSGNGTFTAPNLYTFNGTESSVQFWLKKSTIATLDIDVSDGSATDPDNAGSEDLPLAFTDAALRFYADGVASSIGNQIAGKESDIAPGIQALTLRAVETSSDTGACVARFTGSQTIKMAYECISPASCATANATAISGTTIAEGTVGTTDVTLTFDASGSAPFTVNYLDAGQIQLHATTSLAAVAPDPAATLSGSSNNFVVRPFGFDLDFGPAYNLRAADWADDNILNGSSSDSSYAADANGSVFATAGDNFNMQITAVRWEAGDDLNNDGIPDSGANLSDNITTPNFSSALDFSFYDQNSATSSSGGTASPSFSSGVAIQTLNWPEVGIIDITPSVSSYLGSSGADITTTAFNVGRFIPASFQISLNNTPSFAEAVTGGTSSFTYLGQEFVFSNAPSITISALNSNGVITHNYEGSFWKLGSTLSLTTGSCGTAVGFCYTDNAAITDSAGNPVLLNSPTSAIAYGDTSSVSGIVSLSLHSGVLDLFSYSKPTDGSTVNPFDADVRLNLVIQDSDNISGNLATTTDSANIGFSSDTLDDPDGIPLSGDESYNTTNDSLLRYGRATIPDTVAAGTTIGTTADVPLMLQYYDGNGFVINGDDISTTVVHSSGTPAFTCTDPDTVNDTLACASVSITDTTAINNGTFPFVLNSSINDNGGTLIYMLENTVLPGYLTFDWDGDGVLEATDKASASVTFAPPSYYHGDSRFIYWREQNR